jgi:hypothetical protein
MVDAFAKRGRDAILSHSQSRVNKRWASPAFSSIQK